MEKKEKKKSAKEDWPDFLRHIPKLGHNDGSRNMKKLGEK